MATLFKTYYIFFALHLVAILQTVSSRTSSSYCRAACIHSTFRPFSSFTSVDRSVVDVSVKLQMSSVTTSDKHGTETSSSAIEFCYNRMSVFQVRCRAKQTAKSAWFGKGSKACDMLQTAAWKCRTGLENEMNTGPGQTMTVIFYKTFTVLDRSLAMEL